MINDVVRKTYTVVVYEAEPDEGGYWCEVVDLPGCVAQGDTLDELKDNMIAAIMACEETLAEMGAAEKYVPPHFTWNVSVEGDPPGVGGLLATGIS